MDWTRSVTRRPVAPCTLRSIHASDQDMYPADLPLSRLQAWVDTAPELALEFYLHDNVPIGVVVALPVRRASWEALLKGTLKETNIDASRDFGPAAPGDDGVQESVGVHIFHVEKYEPLEGALRTRGFGKFAVDVVLDEARARGYRVIGTSALTATEDGHRTFEKLGYMPTGYEEVWVEDEAPRSGTEVLPVDIGDGSQVSRARMVRRDEVP